MQWNESLGETAWEWEGIHNNTLTHLIVADHAHGPFALWRWSEPTKGEDDYLGDFLTLAAAKRAALKDLQS